MAIQKKAVQRIIQIILPAAAILFSIYFFFNSSANNDRYKTLSGQSLAANTELYPIRFDVDGRMYLDKDRFMQSVDFLSRNPNQQKAAADLIYLGQANKIELSLSDDEKKKYHLLIGEGFFEEFQDSNKQKDQLLQSYKQIVDGIGKTFAGMDIEIVLHDTRDPIHSVSAIQNPISGRKLGDNNSNFGVELIKLYAQPNTLPTNFVSYPLKLKDGRDVKSTTIPLFDPRFGLIGFICMNIDISKLDGAKEHVKDVQIAIDNIKAVVPNQTITEVIEISRKK